MAVLQPGESRIDELQAADLLTAQRLENPPVDILRCDIRQVFGLDVFDQLLELPALSGQLGQDLMLQIDQRLFHFILEVFVHDTLVCALLPKGT